MTESLPVTEAAAAIRAEAAVAGGMVVVRLSGMDDLHLTMSQAYYEDTPEATMGADLARAVRLLAARRQEALEGAGLSGRVRPPAGSRLAAELEEFNHEADLWAGDVESSDRCVRVSTVGMREFVVEVDPEAKRTHGVETFCHHAAQVGAALIRERVAAMFRQRMEYQRREDDERVLGLR